MSWCKQKGQNKEVQGKCCKSTRKQPQWLLAPAKTSQPLLNSDLPWAIALLLYAFSHLACKMHAVFLESFESCFAASGLNPLLPTFCIGHTLCFILCTGVLAGRVPGSGRLVFRWCSQRRGQKQPSQIQWNSKEVEKRLGLIEEKYFFREIRLYQLP